MRCYEFYAIYNRDSNNLVCHKPRTTRLGIEKYMAMMRETYGIKFDGTPEDRQKFIGCQRDFPEYEVYNREAPEYPIGKEMQHVDLYIPKSLSEQVKEQQLYKKLGFAEILAYYRDRLTKALEQDLQEVNPIMKTV